MPPGRTWGGPDTREVFLPYTSLVPPPVQRSQRAGLSVPPIPPPVRYARRFDGQWLTATSLTGPWRQWPHPDQGLPPGTWEVLPEGLSDAGVLCWWASGRVQP